MVSRAAETWYGVVLSQEEKASVAPFLKNDSLISGLLNDLYSFPKEFNELNRIGSLDMIHNGVAVLMHGYGYSEDEAADIIRQEISAAERNMMDGYRAWEASRTAKKSEVLRKYVLHSILALGGMIYWQSHSQRYHRSDLTTTAADRAQLVAKYPKGIRRLKGYPPPAAFKHFDFLNSAAPAPALNQDKTNGVKGMGDGCSEQALANGPRTRLFCTVQKDHLRRCGLFCIHFSMSMDTLRIAYS